MSYDCKTFEVARDLTNYLLRIGASFTVVCYTDKFTILSSVTALTEAIWEAL